MESKTLNSALEAKDIATDGAYILAQDADGKTIRIAKADLASVLAEQMRVKFGSFVLSSNASITLTLGAGLLVVVARGSQNSYIYNIDYWRASVISISETQSSYITVTKNKNSKDVTITNIQTGASDYIYIFIG